MRENAENALIASYLQEANRVDGTDAPFENPAFNSLVALDPKWCRAQVRTLKRRLRDRADLARALRPWIRDILGTPHPPMAGIQRFSQRQIALFLCDDDIERARNFQARVWRPGRPILHIVSAQDLLLCDTDSTRNLFEVDLARVASVLGEIVHSSESLRARIVQDPRFGVSADVLLKFEWHP